MTVAPTALDSVQLRMLWGVVDTHSELLRDLSDDAICYWILKKIRERLYLTAEEAVRLQGYLYTRTQLIRIMVESSCVAPAVTAGST